MKRSICKLRAVKLFCDRIIESLSSVYYILWLMLLKEQNYTMA